jgi:hypothetical protein
MVKVNTQFLQNLRAQHALARIPELLHQHLSAQTALRAMNNIHNTASEMINIRAR